MNVAHVSDKAPARRSVTRSTPAVEAGAAKGTVSPSWRVWGQRTFSTALHTSRDQGATASYSSFVDGCARTRNTPIDGWAHTNTSSSSTTCLDHERRCHSVTMTNVPTWPSATRTRLISSASSALNFIYNKIQLNKNLTKVPFLRAIKFNVRFFRR